MKNSIFIDYKLRKCHYTIIDSNSKVHTGIADVNSLVEIMRYMQIIHISYGANVPQNVKDSINRLYK